MGKLAKIIEDRANDVLPADDALLEAALNGSRSRIQTVNLHHLALCRRSSVFEETLRRANYITADGWPVVWILKMMGIEVDRVTGATFIEKLTFDKEAEGLAIGLLGATDAAGEDWRILLNANGRALKFREHGLAAEWDAMDVATLAADSGVAILVVAVTPPLGDVIAREIHDAGFPGVLVPVGGAVDMVTGRRPRAPRWARRCGLEWLHRLAKEPRRLWRRYIFECLPTLVEFFPIAMTYYTRSFRKIRGGDADAS